MAIRIANGIKLRPDLEDENERYVTGGAPLQPLRAILPPKESMPTVRTERLCLRPLTHDDAQAIFDCRSKDLRLNHFKNIDDVHAWMDRKIFSVPSAPESRRVQYAVVLGDNPGGPVIGSVGLNQVHPVPNIGYGIDERFWGKGYASEAVGGLLKMWWGLPRTEGYEAEEKSDDWDGKERVFATADKENTASLRVLEKNGFYVYFERTMGDGVRVCSAAVERPDN